MLDNSLIENLKRVDPDRYRAALLAPKPIRIELLTLYAFHAELAKVPEVVSEPMIGNIRYQWWRDALDEIYSGKPIRAHEVVEPLAALVRSKNLSRFHLDQLIDGRERDLDPTPFKDFRAAQDYCEKTSGILAMLAATICGSKSVETAKTLGTVWGLTGLARSWKYYTNGMLSNLNHSEITNEIEKILSDIKSNGRLDSELVPAIGYATLIPGFLKIMREHTYDASTMTPQFGQFRKKLRLMKLTLTGQI